MIDGLTPKELAKWWGSGAWIARAAALSRHRPRHPEGAARSALPTSVVARKCGGNVVPTVEWVSAMKWPAATAVRGFIDGCCSIPRPAHLS